MADIAAQNNISKKFLDTILLELRNGGLLRSRKAQVAAMHCQSPHRKYLYRPSIRILDGPLAPFAAPAENSL